MAREGEHAAAAWKSVNRRPCLASLSMFGVLISPPKQERSLNPRSSATITRKLGRFGAAIMAVWLWTRFLNEVRGTEMRFYWREVREPLQLRGHCSSSTLKVSVSGGSLTEILEHCAASRPHPHYSYQLPHLIRRHEVLPQL